MRISFLGDMYRINKMPMLTIILRTMYIHYNRISVKNLIKDNMLSSWTCVLNYWRNIFNWDIIKEMVFIRDTEEMTFRNRMPVFLVIQ